jgi:hypothetical protein
VDETPKTIDALPEDLKPSYGADEYRIPDTYKRRLAGYLYITTALIFILLYLLFQDSPLVNEGFLISGICIAFFGAFNFFASVRCAVDEIEALQLASESIGFEVGPASAQLMWRGFRSRPVWRLLAYSLEAIPLKRAVILVDASNGEILEQVVEDNPEEWDEAI